MHSPLKRLISNDATAANRIMGAQALGGYGDPDTAFNAIRREIDKTEEGYVFLFALNVFQYSHTDDRLTLQGWKSFQEIVGSDRSGADRYGWEYAQRLMDLPPRKWSRRNVRISGEKGGPR